MFMTGSSNVYVHQTILLHILYFVTVIAFSDRNDFILHFIKHCNLTFNLPVFLKKPPNLNNM
jgi:hypothetical protein